ncbi:MBG domain-containing protein [Myroides sp. DW712]|uniref:MBG domain-containing protein n=1 Tax=Myroides sp. DW712 TaxID=3389800 RepID=UPI00397C3360
MNKITHLPVCEKNKAKRSRWLAGWLLFFTLFSSSFAFAQFPSPYCDVEGGDVEEITKIEFVGVEINNTNDVDLLVDFTANVAEVTAGQTYTLTVQGNTYGEENKLYAFIDWNQNGVLDDAGEVYVIGVLDDSNGADGQSISIDITVPTTAVAGETRIRITKTWIFDEFLEANPDPCWISGIYIGYDLEDDSYGQAIDFTLNVDSDNEAPEPGESCEIGIHLTFPEYGDVTIWKLLDADGTAVLSGGPYNYLIYEDFEIHNTYTGANPPYSLQIQIDDSFYWSCDNIVEYEVTVGGVVDVSGTLDACMEERTESYPINGCVIGCMPPTTLTKTNSTTTGFTLSWTSDGDLFEIEYGPAGFTQGSAAATVIQNITTTSYTFTNLVNDTAYDFYVRRICTEEGEESQWKGPLVFDDFIVTPSPWHEDFSGGLTYPLGWKQVDGVTWEFSQMTADRGTSISAYLYDFSFLGAEPEARFSTITVGPLHYGDTLSFDYLFTDAYGGLAYAGLGHLEVEMSTDFGTTYEPLARINSNGTSGWQTFTHELEDYAGMYVKFRVKAVIDDYFAEFEVALDDFDISGGVDCEEVTAAEVEVIANEMVLTITSEGTTFDIEYGFAGFERGTGTTVESITSPYVFTGLLTSREYEVYVRALPCGTWFGPVPFTSLPPENQIITAEDVEKVYGDLPFVQGTSDSGLALSYMVEDETVAQFENGKLVIKGAGTTTVTASQAGNNAYLPAEDVTFTLTVTKAMLTVQVDAGQEKRYGSEDPTFTYSVTGFKYEDSAAVLTGTLDREPGEEIGTYPITQGTLDGGRNYEIAFTSADFEILIAELLIIAENQTKEYGEDDPVFTYRVTGLLHGDTAEDVLTGTLGREAGENVGTYAINQGELQQLGSNYELSFQGAEMRITPANLVVVAHEGIQKVYGQTDPTFEYTVTGLKWNDTAVTALIGTLGRQMGENVGLYGYAIGNLQALHENYSLTVSDLEKFEITPAPLEIEVIENQFKTYGTADPILTFNTIGLQRGDYPVQVITGRLTRDAGEEIGLYAINQGTLAVNNNYELISFTGADFEIKQGQITGLSLPNRVFVYDGQVKALQVEGNIHSEVTITYTNNHQTEVGDYAVTAVVDYGSAFETITLQGMLKIVKADQTIDFDTLTTVVIEDTPTLQLTATASSGLPVSYRIDDPIDQEVATVDAQGMVRFLRPGFVTLTAYQPGNENYNPAIPVYRTIEVTSRAVGIENLIIDGISYGKPEKEVYVIIGCDHPQDQVVIEVQVMEGIVVSPSNYITVAVKDYGSYKQVITVTSPRGTEQETYTIYIDKRISTTNIVYQKYNNMLLVNNNKQTNGGYVFKGYEWFKNGESIGNQQAYSAGNNFGDVLEVGAEYHVVLTLHNGKKIVTCPIVIENKEAENFGVYPNPVQRNQMLHVRFDNHHQVVSYVIYNIKGQLIKQGEFAAGDQANQIEIPSTFAVGSYILVLKENGVQKSVPFIVRE